MTDLIIENDKDFTNVTVHLDGTSFSRCTFIGCDVYYAGGFYGADACKWDRCRFHLDGAAGRTATFMDSLGFLGDDLPFFVTHNSPTSGNA